MSSAALQCLLQLSEVQRTEQALKYCSAILLYSVRADIFFVNCMTGCLREVKGPELLELQRHILRACQMSNFP